MPTKRTAQQRKLKQTTLFDTVLPPTSTSNKILSTNAGKQRGSITQTPLASNDTDGGKHSTTVSSDSEEVTHHQVKRKRKNPRVCSDNSEEGRTNHVRTKLTRFVKRRYLSSDDEPTGSAAQGHRKRKGRLLRQKKSHTTSSEESDIVGEVEQDRILQTRLRARDKKTIFQKNLEKLKKRKQGRHSETTSSEYDNEDSDAQGRGSDMPFKGSRPQSEYDSLFDEDSDEKNSSDFIVDDDGAAAMVVLPVQFSLESHQDLSYQFKKIFQFFVHIAVRPAIERHEFMKQQMRDEEYFSVPLQVVRRTISGLRDSLVASSVWRPEFKNLLEKHPDFDLIPLDFTTPSCDACHLGGRLSTLIGRLSGPPYDRLGFESMIDSDSDSESEPEGCLAATDFNLGRFCGKRTQVFHQFSHWEYSLFNCVRQEVDELHASDQSGGFFRIGYTGGKMPPKDLGDADGICDWLDERKLIDMEWQKIAIMMESARKLEIAKKRGDDD